MTYRGSSTVWRGRPVSPICGTSSPFAESLHGNFYNNWKTEEMVRSNVEDSKRLLAMLGIVYDNGGLRLKA